MVTRTLTPRNPPSGLDLFGDPPAGFGSREEWVVFSVLLEEGLVPEVDFFYQAAVLGGRTQLGGIVVDFLFHNPPNLAINPQGVYIHYEQGAGLIQRDRLAREILAARGISLIFIDSDHLDINPRFYVKEALQYRDHSRLGQGGF